MTLRNMGTGVAFNIASVLYGCAAYLDDSLAGVKLSQGPETHWSRRLGAPIAPGEQQDYVLKIGASTFLRGNHHIRNYPFQAPEQPSPAAIETQAVLWRVARLTTTYYDISGRKYASIFDYVYNRGWYKVDVIRDIERDLDDLDGFVPKVDTTANQQLDCDEEAETAMAYLETRRPLPPPRANGT